MSYSESSPESGLERTATEFLAAGFQSGVPLRPLLDRARQLYGALAWSTPSAQSALLKSCLNAPMFTYGVMRERRFLRLIFDEVDRCCGGEVAPDLAEAAAARCSVAVDDHDFASIVVGDTVLRCSIAQSNVGMCLWEAGVALHNALNSPSNIIRSTCEMKRVMEIGAGVGLTCTGLRAARVSSAILTELPGRVLDNLRYNVQRNKCDHFVRCEILDVEDKAALEIARTYWVPDVILAADVCYDPDLTIRMVQAFATIIGETMRCGLMIVPRRSQEMYQTLLDELRAASSKMTHEIHENAFYGLGMFPYSFWNYERLVVVEMRGIPDVHTA